MKYIVNILKRVISSVESIGGLVKPSKDLPNPVGRWGIEKCDIKMNHKIELSNEDHCGPCGQYALSKVDNIKNLNNNYTEKNEIKYVYTNDKNVNKK